MIGSPERAKIQRSSIPKIRKIHCGVWKLQAQNSKIGLKWTKFRYSMCKNSPYQNFPGIQSMIFSKRTITTTSIPTIHSMIGSPERAKIQRSSIPKIRKIHSCVWKLQVKKNLYQHFNSQKTRHSMIGSPERVKIQRSSIPKIRKIHSCVQKIYVKTLKTVNFCQKMTKFSS